MATDQSPKSVPQNLGKELGQTGTLVYSGFITGEEYNTTLQGQKAIQMYDKMRRSDGTVQSLLKACKLPLLSTTWDIDAASEDPQDEYIAAFVKNELMEKNVNWHSFIRDALSMFEFGFSLFEKVYEVTEYEGQTRLGLAKLGWRKQLSIYRWETEDGKPGITQQVVSQLLSIPEEKLIIFTNDREGDNWQGISILRYAYKAWDLKNKLDVANAVSLEKLGGGVPILMPPEQPDPEDLARARTAMRNIRINHESFIELPQGWSMEMLDMKSNSVKDMLPTIEYQDKQIMKSGLAAFLEMAASRSAAGSRALSQDHSQFFEKSLEAAANVVTAAVNHHLIQQLCDLNFSDMPNGYPELTFGNIGDEDLTTLGSFLEQVGSVDLITPDRDMENRLREISRMPELPKEIYDDYDNRIVPKNVAPGVGPVAQNDGATAKPPLSKDGENVIKDKNMPVDDRNKPDNSPNDPNSRKAALTAAQKARRDLIDVLVN